MPATLTPLRYPGGKTKYSQMFAEILSLNGFSECTFVEAFAGGAGAAISLLLKGHVNSLILNDLDLPIFSFWKCVIELPEELIGLIRRTRVSVEEWRKQKEIYAACDPSDVLLLGFATFFLNRCNHSGILGARPIGGMDQTGSYSISSRFNKSTSIAKIEAIAERANSIEVFNLDGLALLRVLAQRHYESECFLYLDPPYFQKGPKLYLNHFSDKDHVLLKEAILKCPFPWVLSYDAHPEIVRLYEEHDCQIYRNRLRHTITGNKLAEELIITRLRMPERMTPITLSEGVAGRTR